MQARPVVVAVEVVALEREVGKGMRPVHDDLDAPLAPHSADLAYREDLPGEVGDVADEDDPGARSHRPTETVGELVEAGRRHGEGNRAQDDPVAPLALPPGREHSRVVLVRGEDFVARLQVEPEDAGLEGLAGVPGDRHLLGVAPEGRGQPPPHRLDLGLQQLPHRVDRGLVRQLEVPPHRFLDDAWRGRDAAVVEVDESAVDGERLLDLAPEVFVGRDVRGRPPGGGAPRGLDRLQSTGAEGGPSGGPHRDALQERAPILHVIPPRPPHDSSAGPG